MTPTPHLLVVDDEESNRDMLSRRLERSGFAISSVENGLAALDLVARGGIDLVLLDWMMPGLSGVEVLRLLRANHTAEQLPVIMVTAVTESSKVAQALELGANDYITKPVDLAVTLARIRSQLTRKRDAGLLRASEERYALAARGTNDGIWDWDLVSGALYLCPRWKAMLGYEPQELGTSPEEWFSRVSPGDRPRLERAIREQMREPGDGFECEYRILNRDGVPLWVLCRGVALRNSSGQVTRMVGSQSDITCRKTLDELTGLPNHTYLRERMALALDRLRQNPGEVTAFLYLDLDGFQTINATLGSAAGDELVVEVASRLRSALEGRAFIVGRIGHDEFGVLLENLPYMELAAAVAERILAALRPVIRLDGRPLFCTASIGVAFARPESAGPVEVLRDAETAMHAARGKGHGRVVVFDSAMRDRAEARLEMESDLRCALEQRQFSVFYQPRVHLSTGRIYGFEALVRWHHPRRGLVMPADFIPLAEENGLIHDIGMWVLGEACRQTVEWQRRHPQNPPLEISVNVSPRQCREPDLRDRIAAVLAETGIPASTLQLEITESLLLEDLREARQILLDLKALGVGLKIDDFGTGYSSLRYLSELPFDALKIDRAFTDNLSRAGEESEDMVRTILMLAHNLHLEVVAEGVENLRQVERLRAAGCEFGQGYLFSRPVDAETAHLLLVRGSVDLPSPAGAQPI